jgi:DNA repair exonuclease SbcCD nuclease subunit
MSSGTEMPEGCILKWSEELGMKIIHCADIHLDSRMNGLERDKARKRNMELLNGFERMVQYGAGQGVGAILISGDLFDTGRVSATTRNAVKNCIQSNAGINFYYLRGNHDNGDCLGTLEDKPANLHFFGNEWTTYTEEEGRITITGMELDGDNSGASGVSLVLGAECFNIVMLHGQEYAGMSGDRADAIPLKELKNKGIDYLALGHVHAYKHEKLDARGSYCYPGCLEGRGFDEAGEHGFALLDIDTASGKYTHEFVPWASRNVYVLEVDVSGCLASHEMAARLVECLEKAGCRDRDIVKAELVGELDVECEKDIDYITTVLMQHCYHGKVSDRTTLGMDERDYMLDQSLKGEFVRQVMGDDTIPDEDKPVIVRCGLQALML